jgi:trimeric autotransporter adhesin
MILISLLISYASFIQAGYISTIAGNGTARYFGDGLSASSAVLNGPTSIAVDASGGNIVFSDNLNFRIRRINSSGTISTVAGNGTKGPSLNGVAATSTSLNSPQFIALDNTNGNIYYSDAADSRIRVISAATGILTVVAGNGVSDFSGDGGQATSASLNKPQGIARGIDQSTYIADSLNNRIRKISPAGIITTVAGNGAWSFFGDGGQATSASLRGPSGVAVDASGNIYIADLGNARIRKVSSSGVISTICGTDVNDFSGDGGPASLASLYNPTGVFVNSSTGEIYITDSGNSRIRKISASGIISTVAGNGQREFSGDGGPATLAALGSPQSAVADAFGNIYIADVDNNRIRFVTAVDPTPSSSATTSSTPSPSSTSTLSSTNTASFTATPSNTPSNLPSPSNTPSIFPTMTTTSTPGVNTLGAVTLVAGDGVKSFYGDGGPATSAAFNSPYGMAIDRMGTVYIADSRNHRIRRVSPSGYIVTFAGTGTAGAAGNNGSATSAQLNNPYACAVDDAGNVFIADASNNRIQKVNTSGFISTVAGTGVAGISGDGGLAVFAKLNFPTGIALDAQNNMYISDTSNSRIRKVVAATGIISTIAGIGNQTGGRGFSGENRPATSATLNLPYAVAVDANGMNVYIADTYNNRIRKINASGIISTIAGTNETSGFSGDGIAATSSRLNQPYGVAVDLDGNVYIADYGNDRIRKVNTSGIISTAVGTGVRGSLGSLYRDGLQATEILLTLPQGVAVDPSGKNLYVADSQNSVIRRVSIFGALPSSSPSISPASTLTPSNTPTIPGTPSQTPSIPGTPSQTSSLTPSSSQTSSQTPSNTATPSQTPSQTSSSSPTISPTMTPSQTVTPSQTASTTPSQTSSNTGTPSNTPSQTTTPSQTPTQTSSYTGTASITSSQTSTPTRSQTPSYTSTVTPSQTASSSSTITPTLTPSQTSTPSQTASSTSTQTATRTPTSTQTPSSTRTPKTTSAATSSPSPSSGSSVGGAIRASFVVLNVPLSAVQDFNGWTAMLAMRLAVSCLLQAAPYSNTAANVSSIVSRPRFSTSDLLSQVLIAKVTNISSQAFISFNASSDINRVIPLNMSCSLVTSSLSSQGRVLQASSSNSGLQFDFDIIIPADSTLAARTALIQQYLTVFSYFFSRTMQPVAALTQLLQDAVLALVNGAYGSTSGYTASSNILANGSPYSYNVPSSSTSSYTTNAIIGGVIGGVGGLIVIALIIFFVLRSKKKSNVITSEPVGNVETKHVEEGENVVMNPTAAKSKTEFVPEAI